jgi:hypothetical protein
MCRSKTKVILLADLPGARMAKMSIFLQMIVNLSGISSRISKA